MQLSKFKPAMISLCKRNTNCHSSLALFHAPDEDWGNKGAEWLVQFLFENEAYG